MAGKYLTPRTGKAAVSNKAFVPAGRRMNDREAQLRTPRSEKAPAPVQAPVFPEEQLPELYTEPTPAPRAAEIPAPQPEQVRVPKTEAAPVAPKKQPSPARSRRDAARRRAEKDAAAMRLVRRIVATVLSVVFALGGIAAGALAIHLCKTYPDKEPVLLTPTDSANDQIVAMMDAVCAGDYEKASTYILGSPELGVREPTDQLGVMLWDALLKSMKYELSGECYTTNAGLAQDLSFTYMDPNSVTANLRTRSQAMLEQRVAEAEDVSEIYDEENNYREEFVMDILYDTARDALAEDAKTVTVSLTVNLKYQEGQWWIVADTALLDAISGGILF